MPRDRILGSRPGLPRRQGGSWSGSAAIASCVGERGSVEPDRLVAHVGGAVGVEPAAGPVAQTGATRRGTSQSVVRRMPIAVRSYVARRYRKNIRRYRQWRACAEKSAGSFSASCAGSHEADSSGKVQSETLDRENSYPSQLHGRFDCSGEIQNGATGSSADCVVVPRPV